MSLPHCPQCNSEYTYEDNGMFICPECAHEWNDAEPAQDSDELIVKDANGNLLADGDSVTVVKDLKVKGSSSMLKIGTKVKNIRLVEGDHNIDCKIDGFGPMKLKSEFVKRTDANCLMALRSSGLHQLICRAEAHTSRLVYLCRR